MKTSKIALIATMVFTLILLVSSVTTYLYNRPKSNENWYLKTSSNTESIDIIPSTTVIPTLIPTPTNRPTITPTVVPVIKEKINTPSPVSMEELTKTINVVMGNIISRKPFTIQGTGFGNATFMNNSNTTRYIILDPENGQDRVAFYVGTHQLLSTSVVIERGVRITYMTMGPVPKEWREYRDKQKEKDVIEKAKIKVTPIATAVIVKKEKRLNNYSQNKTDIVTEIGNPNIYKCGELVSYDDKNITPMYHNSIPYLPLGTFVKMFGGSYDVDDVGSSIVNFGSNRFVLKHKENIYAVNEAYGNFIHAPFLSNGIMYISYDSFATLFGMGTEWEEDIVIIKVSTTINSK